MRRRSEGGPLTALLLMAAIVGLVLVLLWFAFRDTLRGRLWPI